MEPKETNFKFSPELYDKQANWEKRLASEKEFFLVLFSSNSVRKVLDIGCGTGRHAMMFDEFVDEVFAMDPSVEMIDYARENVVKSKKIRLMHGGFKELANIPENNFDAITCLGNTLPLLETRKKVKNALRNTRAKLKKGGIAVFQFINFEKEMIEKNRYYEPKVVNKDGMTYVFTRHFEYGKLKTNVDFITTVLNSSNNIEVFNVDTTIMCTLKIRIFNKMALSSGFKKINYFVNSAKENFDNKIHQSFFAVLRT